MIKQVLLAGGEGKRVAFLLQMPKQFCKLINTNNRRYSTFMLAIERAKLISESEDIIVVVNQKYIEIAINQIMEIESLIDNNAAHKITLLIEHETNNTLAAIYQVLQFIKQYFPQEKDILIAPCDHLIENLQNYFIDIKNAIITNKNFSLLSIKPNNFEESYKYGNIISDCGNNILYFYEKPTLQLLENIMINKSFKHSWNSGIFLFKIDFIVQKISEIFKINYEIEYINNKKLEKIDFPLEKIFFMNNNVGDLLKISFDFLIPHVLKSVKVFECSFDWIDIGSPEKIMELVS